jgi:predicted RNase H-like nuclease
LFEEWQSAKDTVEKGTHDEHLQEQIAQSIKLLNDITNKKIELEAALHNYDASLNALTGIYNWLIQTVLSDGYSGKVSLSRSENELKFTIHEETGLSGEAVETLSLVLADLAAVFCSVNGSGYHPRFLLHDSPREADLDRHIYNHFLEVAFNISEQLGGANAAPFQYIVTTTSRPPDRLQEAKIVKLELGAHPEEDMLFKCRLRQESVQGELFQ